MKKLLPIIIASMAFNVAAATNTTSTEIVRTTVNESEMNRIDKEYQITLNSGIAYSLPVTGIKAGKFLDENKMLELSFLSFKDDETEDEYGYDEGPMYDGSALEVSYKQFERNSFYYQATAYYRDATTIDSITTSYINGIMVDKDYDGKVSFTDVGVGIKIGNQWHWDNFTIGCDWIGITKSIATLSEDSEDNEESRYIAASTQTTLLNLYLGASF